MNIVISQRIGQNQYGAIIDSLESNYPRFFSSFGVNLLPVTNLPNNFELFTEMVHIDRIILSGGNDINEKNNYIRLRNETERKLLDLSVKKNIPLLGICRGMQFIHHYFRGKLIAVKNHVKEVHPIEIVSDKYFKNFKPETTVEVNSYHSFVPDEKSISSEIEIFARSKADGVIEAFFHRRYPILGILWHPERNKSCTKIDKILINAFLKRELFWNV